MTTSRPAVLVEFYVTKWQSHLLAYAPGWDEVRHHSEYLGWAAVRELAEFFAASVAERPTNVSAGLAALDQSGLPKLLRPLLEWTSPDQPLVFVPHEALHRLPLHAIGIAAGGALLDRQPITYVPSATTLRYCRARRSRTQGGMLFVVDSRPDRSLSLVRSHADLVAADRADVVVLSGPTATLAQLHRHARAASPAVLHMGVHGSFDPDRAEQSGLALFDEDLDLQRMLELPLSGTVAVLLACESGQTQLLGGGELIGLTRAAFYAGARSVLAGMWSLDELPASVLAAALHRELATGAGPAEALRHAALSVRTTTAGDALLHLERLRAGAPSVNCARDIRLAEAEVHIGSSNAPAAHDAAQRVTSDPLATAAQLKRARAIAARAALLRRKNADPDPGRFVLRDASAWAAIATFGAWDW